jgi:hypothetical protein
MASRRLRKKPKRSKKYKRKSGPPKKSGYPARKPAHPEIRDDAHKLILARTLRKDLIATGGDISRAAHRTAVSRKAAYNMIKYWGLWPLVNECRRKRYEATEVDGSNLIQRTHLAMRG